MRIAYYFTIPRPPVPELDGAVQEALWLREEFGGELEFLYPARRFHRTLPPQLCGLRHRRRLAELDRQVDLHHIFSGGLIRYPFLGRLTKPLVYTLTTSLGDSRPGVDGGFARRWVVGDPADAGRLTALGFDGVEAVLPGLDLERFPPSLPPAGGASSALGDLPPAAPPGPGDFVLLAGSAPWSRRQFRTKGVDLLLDAVAATPDLRLVLLWRQVLLDEIRRRVERRGLAARVEVIEGVTDVGALLRRVHAAVVLSAAPKLIKAFPHSLLEALAVGRPVLVSAGLGLAELVRAADCGVVVKELTADSLGRAIGDLRRDYERLQAAAVAFDRQRFSRPRFLADYERIYREALAAE